MANALYDKGREGILDGSISIMSGIVKVALVDLADYTPNLATHGMLSDIPSVGRVAISPALTAKTATGGVFDAADVTYPAVTGDQSEALVIFMDTGTDTTSRLVAIIDTASGLPVTPNGGPITIGWANTSNRIFKL